MMDQRISLITLGVKNLDATRNFYEEGMGWNPGFAEDNITFYQLNGIVFALFPKDDFDKDAHVKSVEGPSSVALAYNVASKEEVDQVVDQARAAGATIVKEPGDTFWGGYSGHFLDPDEHVWEVASNPFWRIDDQGNIWMETK